MPAAQRPHKRTHHRAGTAICAKGAFRPKNEMKMAEPAPYRFRVVEDSADPALDEKISIPLSTALLDRIKDYRFSNRIDSLSDAVRRLIVQGLETEQGRKRPT